MATTTKTSLASQYLAVNSIASLIQLPELDNRCLNIPEVYKNRQDSLNFINQILAMQKLNGNFEDFNFQVSNYWTSTNYNDGSTFPQNAEPYLSRRQAACGDLPGGLRFKAKNDWYNCVDNWNPKYYVEQNCIIASKKERDWLDNKVKELTAFTSQKLIQNTTQSDVVGKKSATTQTESNNALYIGLGVVLLAGTGLMAYKIYQKRKKNGKSKSDK